MNSHSESVETIKLLFHKINDNIDWDVITLRRKIHQIQIKSGKTGQIPLFCFIEKISAPEEAITQ